MVSPDWSIFLRKGFDSWRMLCRWRCCVVVGMSLACFHLFYGSVFFVFFYLVFVSRYFLLFLAHCSLLVLLARSSVDRVSSVSVGACVSCMRA